jgi:hypothetical protein
MLACCCAAETGDANNALVDTQPVLKARAAEKEEVVNLPKPAAPAAPEPAKTAEPPKEEKVVEEPVAAPKRNFFSQEFEATLRKVTGQEKLGIEVDPVDGEVVQICRIANGLITDYNSTMQDALQIKQDDFIVKVNGVSGNTDAMFDRMQKDSNITLTIKRVRPWEVELTQKIVGGSELRPLITRAENGRSIVIKEDSDPIIQAWNAAHPNLDIKKHDRILWVNGTVGSKQMMDQMEKVTGLNLQVARPNPDRI